MYSKSPSFSHHISKNTAVGLLDIANSSPFNIKVWLAMSHRLICLRQACLLAHGKIVLKWMILDLSFGTWCCSLYWSLFLLKMPLCYRVQYCSPYNKPINQKTRWGVGARKSDFIQKAHRPTRWWASVLKNHLTHVKIQGSFILKGRGCGWCLQTSWSLNPLFLQLPT